MPAPKTASVTDRDLKDYVKPWILDWKPIWNVQKHVPLRARLQSVSGAYIIARAPRVSAWPRNSTYNLYRQVLIRTQERHSRMTTRHTITWFSLAALVSVAMIMIAYM